VVTINTFKTEDEAIAKANVGTPVGETLMGV
jgi:hypothetical protein